MCENIDTHDGISYRQDRDRERSSELIDNEKKLFRMQEREAESETFAWILCGGWGMGVCPEVSIYFCTLPAPHGPMLVAPHPAPQITSPSLAPL